MMSGEVRTAATVIDAQIGVVGQNEIPCLVVSFKTNDPRFQTIAAKIFFTPAAEASGEVADGARMEPGSE